MSDLISELGFYAAKQKWPKGLEGMPDLLKRAQAALSTDAEPVDEIIAQRDALIAAGLKCCDGTPNPNLRPFDLAMSFIDSTNTARKAADTLWQEYKVELDALRAAPPAPAVAVKALEWIADENHSTLQRADFYTIEGEFRQGFALHIAGKMGVQWFSTEVEAKAAAQADYEARIRSALSAQVQDVAIQEGWKLVPKEPMPIQLETAAFNLSAEYGPEFVLANQAFARDAYAEIAAAAPAAKLVEGEWKPVEGEPISFNINSAKWQDPTIFDDAEGRN